MRAGDPETVRVLHAHGEVLAREGCRRHCPWLIGTKRFDGEVQRAHERNRVEHARLHFLVQRLAGGAKPGGGITSEKKDHFKNGIRHDCTI